MVQLNIVFFILSRSDPCSKQAAESFKRIGYTILEKINYGSFSKVHKATYNHKEIAVKIIDLKKTSIDCKRIDLIGQKLNQN